MVRLCFLITCLLFSVSAFSAELTLEKKGEFSQEKHFQGFTKPFVSTGYFVMGEQQLRWQIDSPVKSTLIIKGGQVFTRNQQGELQVQAGAEPFAGLLNAILHHDMEKLEQQFSVSQALKQDCKLLLPKKSVLQQVFESFELCASGSQVNRVRLNEHNANYTVITFSYATDVIEP